MHVDSLGRCSLPNLAMAVQWLVCTQHEHFPKIFPKEFETGRLKGNFPLPSAKAPFQCCTNCCSLQIFMNPPPPKPKNQQHNVMSGKQHPTLANSYLCLNPNKAD